MSSREVLGIFAPFGGMFLGFVVLWLSFRPDLLQQLVGKADTPTALLQGYRNWYMILMAAVALSVVLPAAGCVWAAKKKFLISIKLTAICIAFPLLIGGAMLAIEDVPGLWMEAGADQHRESAGGDRVAEPQSQQWKTAWALYRRPTGTSYRLWGHR